MTGEPWTFDPRVDERAFRALGFADTSAGIAQRQRENRQGWWAHAERSKAFILDAAMRIGEPRTVALLGAGKAFDLPLADLARRFGRVILIDVDANALAGTAQSAVRDAALRARLELRAIDLSGVIARLARSIEDAVAAAADATAAENSCRALCDSCRLSAPARFLDEPVDLLVSGLVLTQLALPAKLYAKRLFEQRFGLLPQASPWDALDQRIQQDHIDALPRHAGLAVLISEVLHRVTALDGQGKERPTGESWSLIGDRNLETRVLGNVEIVTRSAWSWPRLRATRDGPGATMDVCGLLLRPR